MENGKIKITITDFNSKVTTFEGDNLFFLMQKDSEGDEANTGLLGNFYNRRMLKMIIKAVVASIDGFVKQKRISKIDAIKLLAILYRDYNKEVNALLDKFADGMTPEEEIELEKEEKRLKELKGYADEIESEDFGDETDNADFTS